MKLWQKMGVAIRRPQRLRHQQPYSQDINNERREKKEIKNQKPASRPLAPDALLFIRIEFQAVAATGRRGGEK